MARFRAMPYAKALFEVVTAADRGRLEQVGSELDRVAEVVQTVPVFQRALTTPTVPVESKSAILDAVLDELQITEPTRRFLHVVQQHYRMEHMADIAATFRELVDRSEGRSRATVEVAGSLDPEAQQQISATLGRALGGDVVAEFAINPELLAGLRVQVGSKVFDGSLAGQVDRLSRETMTE
jgi:F-type H+-transporting ATPase subunit delta